MTSVTRYAFHFDASACSGCKACQVACKDRNDLPLGVRWRRVYEVAGGGWSRRGDAWLNDVFAYNLSVACNHCEDPICMGVCPAGAITRRADGIVLLDARRCLGCRYCEWACPYGAPQYDSSGGHMTKCTFCVEDVEQGLEPACVAACGLRALDFGDKEELDRRHGGTAEVHPLPDPSLTGPSLTMTPHPRSEDAADRSARVANREEVGGIELRERSLVAFTLLAQTAVGMLWALAGLWWAVGTAVGGPGTTPAGASEATAAGATARLLLHGQLSLLAVAGVLIVAAAVVSLLHLGTPRNAWRALSNLRRSWLSREILLLGLLGLGWAVLVGAVVSGASVPAASAGVAALGVGLVYAMSRVYRLRTVPSWDRVRTPVGFFLTAVVLGAFATVFTLTLVSGGGLARDLVVGVLLVGAVAAAGVERSAFYRSYARSGI